MLLLFLCFSKNNRSFDTPVKGPPQGPRLHIDIPRVQLLIEDKEGIKQIGEMKKILWNSLWWQETFHRNCLGPFSEATLNFCKTQEPQKSFEKFQT